MSRVVVARVTESRRRRGKVIKKCTETPLKKGTSGNKRKKRANGRNVSKKRRKTGDRRRRDRTFHQKKDVKARIVVRETQRNCSNTKRYDGRGWSFVWVGMHPKTIESPTETQLKCGHQIKHGEKQKSKQILTLPGIKIVKLF